MIEVEIQKLTAAIEALTKAVLGSGRPTLVVTNGTPTKLTTLEEAERSYREDDAVREAMQAERLAKLDKIEREQAEHAKTMDEVYGKTLAEKKAEDDAMAAIYKREAEKKQTVKARKAHAVVTTEETKALVKAAVTTELVSVAEALAPVAHLIPDAANIGEGDLKALAMEIARADSSARTIILEILGEHGAKTITQLDPKNYRAVHGRFLSLAHDIAKDGEEI